jgi:hypothetical protein
VFQFIGVNAASAAAIAAILFVITPLPVTAQTPAPQTFSTEDMTAELARLANQPPITSGCAATAAPSAPIAADDFIEYQRGRGQGIFIFDRRPTEVRIHADGRVKWRSSIWNWSGDGSIPADKARALIQKARDNGFWTLCAAYESALLSSHTITDFVNMRIDGREKSVADTSLKAPTWVQDLKTELAELVVKHVWIYGDPQKETFSEGRSGRTLPTDFFNLSNDAFSAKPGVTDLMRASAKSDAVEVQRLLSAAADVNARDASGWTALMFAARGDGAPEVVAALLKAGADPNARSSMGQTPLMAAANGSPEKLRLLIAAGASVNAQDKDGRTALMFAATPQVPGGVQDLGIPVRAAADRTFVLRAAGANVDVRDAAGLSVFDHLADAEKPAPGRAGMATPGLEAIRRLLQ